jgi:DNA polymerase-1
MSTYLTDEGERIRCSYVVGGTKTGRLSSRESIFGSGTNLQNIPKGVCRRMFIPDEGKVFIEADLSQAEARVVAYLSGEEKLIELFEGGGDVHKQVAAWIYSKDVCQVEGQERELAKRLVHASNYGIGPRTFAHHAGIKEGEARVLLQRYFDTFPKIKEWHLRTQASLSKSKTLVTPMGRKRHFYGRWGDQLFREVYAYVPQSTVADVLNLAMIRFNCMSVDEQIMLQIHDAFVIQTPKDKVESSIGKLRGAFCITVTINSYEFVIPVGIKVGNNWDNMKKVS